ncbi:MAG TPA: phosphatidylserine decarboxylase family protein [Gemmatimonadales bacterium]
MRIAPEGWPFILFAGLVLLLLGAFRFWIPFAIWLPLTVWVVAFFRDPAREGPRGERLVLAPADGKVVAVALVEEPTFVRGPASRISIFMNVLDVHVNRYPADGVVAYRAYNPGKFVNAATDKASLDNEQSSVGITTPRGPLLVRQIAGLIARRIVTDHAEGTGVRQGQRMGMIRFGSRVDLFLPPAAKVLAQVGDVTRAGLTVVAEWP